jgi:glycosyltransferase involved in cell wall biosynthesis
LKPLLSIAIPTFNRPDKIKSLYENFLSKIDLSLGSNIEVVVCDNSDLNQAETNRKNLADSNTNYKKNNTNLGFSGNVIRCLQEVNGEFVWIISDDDEVDYDAFCRLIKWLNKSDLNDFNAIMLPFYICSDSGARYLVNTQEEWGAASAELSDMIRNNNNIPFILFSSVILRNKSHDKEILLHNIAADFKENDFIQIPLFISLIGKNGKTTCYFEALQEYKSPDYVRFSLIRMAESMEQVIGFISDFYGVSNYQFDKCHYQRWMQWLISHRAGKTKVKDGGAAKWFLIRKWASLHFKNIRHMKLLCLALMPVFLVKKIYSRRQGENNQHNA